MVTRDVIGIPRRGLEQVRAEFLEKAKEQGLSSSERESLQPNTYAGRVALLQDGHLQHFLRVQDIPRDEDTLDGLADYLDARLDPQFDEKIYTAALPATIIANSEQKRTLVIGQTPRLQEERYLIQGTVERYFNVDPATGNWPSTAPLVGCEYMKATHPYSDDVMDLALRIISRTHSFVTSCVEYEPASIDY